MIRLSKERNTADGCSAAESNYHDENISESYGLSDKSTAYGANNRTDKRSKRIYGHGGCTIPLGEEVADSTASAGDRGATRKPSCAEVRLLWKSMRTCNKHTPRTRNPIRAPAVGENAQPRLNAKNTKLDICNICHFMSSIGYK